MNIFFGNQVKCEESLYAKKHKQALGDTVVDLREIYDLMDEDYGRCTDERMVHN